MKYGITTCANCQTEFEKISPGQKACCQQCSTALWYRAHGETPPKERTGICLNCGEEFEWKKSGNDRKYCSKECRTKRYRKIELSKNTFKSRKTQIDVKCPGCQKTYKAFINYIGTGTPRFFCTACKAKNSRVITYNPYDRSAETVLRA